jgi:hypothetical protein
MAAQVLHHRQFGSRNLRMNIELLRSERGVLLERFCGHERLRRDVRICPAWRDLAHFQDRRHDTSIRAPHRALCADRHSGIHCPYQPLDALRAFLRHREAMVFAAEFFLSVAVPFITAVLALGIWRGIPGPRDGLPFLLSVALFVLAYLGLGISLWPTPSPKA